MDDHSSHGNRHSPEIQQRSKELFLKLLEDGVEASMCYNLCCIVFGVSETSLRRWISTPAPAVQLPDQSHHLSGFQDSHLRAIQHYYDIEPTLFNSEMIDIIYLKFHKIFTEQQIIAARKKLNLTYKMLEQKSNQRNEYLREYWRQCVIDNLEELPSYMYMFVDETHLTPEECIRRRGYATKGKRAYSSHWIRATGQPGISGIVSISIEGVRSVSTYNVNVDADIFLDALENDILPHTNPYPGVCSIVCFDNAKVHMKPAIFNLCQAYGVIPLFLPQYSYDMTPIEPILHLAKQYIRRVWGQSHNPLEYQLETSLRNCVTANIACNEFNHVDMKVTEWERAWAQR
jgi:hypothetical protein